ncbi:MAG: transglycosylase SLT domain-containing protein [Rhodoblastus sp.]
MANLPIPDFGLTTAETPRSSVSGDIFRTAPQQSIAPGVAALGEGVDALAVKAAEAQGKEDAQKALILDPATGKFSVATPMNAPFIMGSGGQAYQKAFANGVDAAAHNAIARDLGELGQQFKLDPQGFEISAGKYIDGLRTKFPGAVGEMMTDNAFRRAAAIRGGIVEAKGQSDIETSKANLVNALADSKASLQGAAFGGMFKDEADIEANPIFQTYVEHYRRIGENPLYGMPKSTVERQVQGTLNELRDLRVQGQVGKIKEAQGADAAVAWAHKEIIERESTVPMAERIARFNFALGEIGRLTEQQRADQKAANATAQSYIQLYHGRTPPEDAQIEIAIEASRKAGDVAGASALRAARDAYQAVKPTLGVGAQGMAAAGIGPVSWQTVHGAIIGQESGGNPLAPKSVTGATGIGQIQPETFKQYAKPGERIDNPADNLAVSQRIVQDLYQKAGGDPARVAVGYFSGPGNIAPLGAPTPYKEDRADPTGKTTSSYVADVVKRLGGTMTVSGRSPITFSAARLAADPGLGAAAAAQFLADRKAVGHFVDTQVDAMTTMVKQGLVAPNATDLANVMQLGIQFPEHAPKVQKLVATVDAARMFDANAASPTPVSGAALVQQAWQMAQANPSIYTMHRFEAAQHIEASQDALMKKEPLVYAAQRGWSRAPQPLNFQDPNALAAEMASRGDAATRFQARQGYWPDIIQPGEMEHVKSLMEFGSHQQKAALVASLAHAPGPAMQQTLQQFAKDKQTAPLAIVASLAATDRAEIAKGVLAGMDAMKAEPKLAGDDDLRSQALNKALPVNALQPDVRDAIGKAAAAYYAYASSLQADTSGGFKKERFDDALQKVTGGVLDFRGSKVIAPWPAATEGHLTHVLNNLTADDFRGAVTASGEAFPARYLQTRGMGDLAGSGRWRLQSYRDGKYLVFSGDDSARRYLQNSAGGPFVLDLRNKQTVESATIPNFITPPPGAILSKDQIMGAGGFSEFPDKARPLPVSAEMGS